MKPRLYDMPVVAGVAVVFCLGTISPASAGESTKKQPDPTEMHAPDENRQITVGGADYFVEGELLGIEGQRYTIKRHQSGEQVRVVVNQDTNLDCAAVPASRSQKTGKKQEAVTSERIPPDKQAPKATERQIEQGQRKNETARGGGFRVGQCDFQRGDMVKAEVDDMGRVTTLKFLGSAPAKSPRSTGTSALTGELGIPDIRGAL